MYIQYNIDKTVMTNVYDKDYSAYVWAGLYDKDWNEVDCDYTVSLVNDSHKNTLKIESWHGVEAWGADPGTYTLEIKASQNDNESVTFTKHVTLTMKSLPDDAYDEDTGVALTYTAENGTSADIANVYDCVTTRLYATYNGLFAGYVRIAGADDVTSGGYAENGSVSEGDVTIANYDWGETSDGKTKGFVKANDATALANVEVRAEFGTNYYNCTNNENGKWYPQASPATRQRRPRTT